MPTRLEYTAEFKDQAVRLVFESMEPTESRKQACYRVAPIVNVKPVTLYNWVKAATPAAAKGPGRPAAQAGSVEELRAQVAALRKENRELTRANGILQAAAGFFGAVLDRQSKT